MSRRTIHPWLLGAFPCLSIYSHNVGYTPVTKLFQSLLVVELSVTLLWVAAILMLRQRNKASFLVSLLLVVVFSFGPLTALLHGNGSPANFPHYHRTALITELVIFGAGVLWILRTRSSLDSWGGIATTFAFALLAVTTVTIFSNALRSPSKRADRLAQLPQIAFSAFSPMRLPDIYYIVPDAYARSDVLRNVYGFDNRTFIEHLRTEGFFVADSSFSNYTRTILSIPSTLNMEYMQTLFGGELSDPVSSDRIVDLCQHSRLVRVLREQLGYEFIAFASGARWTECKGADQYLSPAFNLRLGEFGHAVLGQTPLPFLADKILRVSPVRWHRQRILFTLDQLPRIASNPKPTFTFAHVVCPHTPFIFDENGDDVAIPGEPLRFEMLEREVFQSGSPDEIATAAALYRMRYRKQVAYMTRRLEEVISEILRRSANPVIVILQSDHGPSSPAPNENNRLWENFANLTAVYGPGMPALPEDLSPVNTFRFLLNGFFGANLEPLPNEYYWYDGRRVERESFASYRVQSGETGAVTARTTGHPTKTGE